MSNKNLLSDIVNNVDEYLEYLHAIGYFEYVKELEEFKEKILNSLPSDEEIEIESDEFELNSKVSLGMHISFEHGAKWMRDKIQGGNK